MSKLFFYLCCKQSPLRSLAAFVCLGLSMSGLLRAEDLLLLDNGTVQVGIDRDMGASITWLSWKSYSKNMINIHDPGRLIQQSYYSGASIDRTSDGQSKAWSPWPWNPIQGGGVSSWARVNKFERVEGETLYAETVPKLWDMPSEEAAAVMRQWTSIEPLMANAVVVRCEFISAREEDDRWGKGVQRHQEIPACYFTRNFANAKSYLGNGKWRAEIQEPGPPWGKASPAQKAMAFFNREGDGVAVFSPASMPTWNFGPHGNGVSDDPKAGPCMHVAPLDLVPFGPKSAYRFRYWLVVGNESEIASSLDLLWQKYSAEKAELVER